LPGQWAGTLPVQTALGVTRNRRVSSDERIDQHYQMPEGYLCLIDRSSITGAWDFKYAALPLWARAAFIAELCSAAAESVLDLWR
jgi:hypothetical protein